MTVVIDSKSSASLPFQTLTQQQGPSLTSISHAASDTTGIHSTFPLQRGSYGCQKRQKLSELQPSISDSSCSSKICSTIFIKSASLITKALHIHTSLHPPLGPQLDQLSGLSRHIAYTYKSTSLHVHHCTACESIFYILCTEYSLPVLLSHRQHSVTFQSLQSSSHHCYQPSL